MEHKKTWFGGEDCHVFSSKNLLDWDYEGKCFDISQVEWIQDGSIFPASFGGAEDDPTPFLQRLMQNMGDDFADTPIKQIFIGQCIPINGRFALSFGCSNNSRGIAFSDSPTGPFKDPLRIECRGGCGYIIPQKDEYFFSCGQFFTNMFKFDPKTYSLDNSTVIHKVITEQEHTFHEDAVIIERDGWYYCLFTSIARHDRACCVGYAMSQSITGPYEYKGVLIDTFESDPAVWTTFGSFFQMNGQWYLLYCRGGGNSRYTRRLCIEPITFNSDGTISEIAMTSQGAGKPYALNDIISAASACALKGSLYIDYADDVSNNEVLKNISDGDLAHFRYIDLDTPATSISIRASGSGTIELLTDDENSQPWAVVKVTNGLFHIQQLQPIDGHHTLILRMKNTSDLEIYSLSLH